MRKGYTCQFQLTIFLIAARNVSVGLHPMEPAIQTVTLSLFRYDGLFDRIAAFSMMGLVRRPLSKVPDLSFWKLCGTGTGEGFSLGPNFGVYALLCVWPDTGTARERLEQSPVFSRMRKSAAETWTVFLAPSSSRGQWSGRTPFNPDNTSPEHALAVLTRASLRLGTVTRFWGRVPGVSVAIGANEDVAFKIGMGEVPLLHQITFSIWPDAQKMAIFAHDTNGPHAEAIRAVREGKWFREELYARFRILGDEGTWEGGSPLEALKAA